MSERDKGSSSVRLIGVCVSQFNDVTEGHHVRCRLILYGRITSTANMRQCSVRRMKDKKRRNKYNAKSIHFADKKSIFLFYLL